MQIDMVTKGKSRVRVHRANPEIILTLPRSTGMSGDTTESGVRDPAPLRGPTRGNTTVAAGQDTAGIGAEVTPRTRS